MKCQTGLHPVTGRYTPTDKLFGVTIIILPSDAQPVAVTDFPSSHHEPVRPTHPPPLVTRPHPKRQRLSPPLEPIPYGALDPLHYHRPPKVGPMLLFHNHMFNLSSVKLFSGLPLQKVQIVGGDLDTLMLCSHELLLPDRPTLHTRMLLGAWEAGLDAVSEDAADLLLLALEVRH